mmetsp:Transcript_23684/g.59825  ORF Transcript_23684/g.59825 Transcript_23684/m.59825 type:complete len:467 (+) Transcript_23684:236-1636(+)
MRLRVGIFYCSYLSTEGEAAAAAVHPLLCKKVLPRFGAFSSNLQMSEEEPSCVRFPRVQCRRGFGFFADRPLHREGHFRQVCVQPFLRFGRQPGLPLRHVPEVWRAYEGFSVHVIALQRLLLCEILFVGLQGAEYVVHRVQIVLGPVPDCDHQLPRPVLGAEEERLGLPRPAVDVKQALVAVPGDQSRAAGHLPLRQVERRLPLAQALVEHALLPEAVLPLQFDGQQVFHLLVAAPGTARLARRVHTAVAVRAVLLEHGNGGAFADLVLHYQPRAPLAARHLLEVGFVWRIPEVDSLEHHRPRRRPGGQGGSCYRRSSCLTRAAARSESLFLTLQIPRTAPQELWHSDHVRLRLPLLLYAEEVLVCVHRRGIQLGLRILLHPLQSHDAVAKRLGRNVVRVMKSRAATLEIELQLRRPTTVFSRNFQAGCIHSRIHVHKRRRPVQRPAVVEMHTRHLVQAPRCAHAP